MPEGEKLAGKQFSSEPVLHKHCKDSVSRPLQLKVQRNLWKCTSFFKPRSLLSFQSHLSVFSENYSVMHLIALTKCSFQTCSHIIDPRQT